MKKKTALLIAIIGIFTLSNCKKNGVTTIEEPIKTLNSVEEIINDMALPHEGAPKGVPDSYDWAKKPRLSMGNNPGNFRAILPWGQVYEDAKGRVSSNTRVHLKNLKAYVLSKKDKKWYLLVASERVEGADYVEDFSNNTNRVADIRNEPDGGVSVIAGGGYNFHFWTKNRVTIVPDDIAGIFSTVEARLVIDKAGGVDDRPKAKFLLSVGADYWLDLTADWDNFKTNGDVGIGRFKYVETKWKAFNMSSLSAEDLRKNPPPLQ